MNSREIEFERLKSNPRIHLVIGDRVLASVGLLGYGYNWVHEECHIIDITGSSVKIKNDEFELWVDPCLILEVLSYDNVEETYVQKAGSK